MTNTQVACPVLQSIGPAEEVAWRTQNDSHALDHMHRWKIAISRAGTWEWNGSATVGTKPGVSFHLIQAPRAAARHKCPVLGVKRALARSLDE